MEQIHGIEHPVTRLQMNYERRRESCGGGDRLDSGTGAQSGQWPAIELYLMRSCPAKSEGRLRVKVRTSAISDVQCAEHSSAACHENHRPCTQDWSGPGGYHFGRSCVACDKKGKPCLPSISSEQTRIYIDALSLENAQLWRELTELQEAHAVLTSRRASEIASLGRLARRSRGAAGLSLQQDLQTHVSAVDLAHKLSWRLHVQATRLTASRRQHEEKAGERSHELHFTNDRGGEVWGGHYVGLTSGMTLARYGLVAEAVSSFASLYSLSSIEQRIYNNQPACDGVTARTVPDAETLLSAYFGGVNATTPVLDQETFYQAWRVYRDRESDLYRPDFDGLVLAMCAFGKRVLAATGFEVPRPDVFSAGEELLHAASCIKVDPVNGCSLFDLQRFALIVLYLTMAASPTRTWAYCTNCLTQAVQVNAQCNDYIPPRWSATSRWAYADSLDHSALDQLRKRAMWPLLHVQRMYTYMLGKPPLHDDGSFDLARPDPWRLDATQVCSLHITLEIGSLTSHVVQTVYAPSNTSDDVDRAIHDVFDLVNECLAAREPGNPIGPLRRPLDTDPVAGLLWAPIESEHPHEEMASLLLFAQIWGVLIYAAQARLLSETHLDLLRALNESGQCWPPPLLGNDAQGFFDALSLCYAYATQLEVICTRASRIVAHLPGSRPVLAQVAAAPCAFALTICHIHWQVLLAQQDDVNHLLDLLQRFTSVLDQLAPQ